MFFQKTQHFQNIVFPEHSFFGFFEIFFAKFKQKTKKYLNANMYFKKDKIKTYTKKTLLQQKKENFSLNNK